MKLFTHLAFPKLFLVKKKNNLYSLILVIIPVPKKLLEKNLQAKLSSVKQKLKTVLQIDGYAKQVTKKLPAPNVGLEPTTLRLRVSCSTD